MRRLLRLAPVIAAPLLLTSCSPPQINIGVAHIGHTVQLKLSQDWGLIFPTRKAPCVRSIELYRGVEQSAVPLWKAEADGNVQCVHNVAAVTLGIAPRGFSSVIPLTPSVAGIYTVVVDGIGSGTANIALP
jgi:hypothetical protein